MLKRLMVNTGVQILGKAITVSTTLLTTGILTRKLGIDAYGNFLLITSILVFFDSLADFGTTTIGVREASKIEGSKSEDNRIKLWSSVAMLRIVMAIISFGLATIFVFVWPDLKEIRVEAILAWAMILFTSVAGSLGIVWQTKLKLEIKVVVEVMFPLVFLIGLWLNRGDITLKWVFSMYLVARIISLVWAWWLGKGNLNIKTIDKEIIINILKMSWPMGVYMLVFSTYDRAVDSLMIKNFLGSSEVAWYGLAYKIYGVLIQPAYFLVSGLFPLLSAKKSQKEAFKLGFWGLLFGGIMMVIGTRFFASWMIITLAGEEYLASVEVLRILAFSLFFSYLGHLFGFTLVSRDGQKEILGLGLIALVFNLVGNIIAIPRFGVSGAAVVTVMTEALAMMLMLVRLGKRKN